MQLINWSDQDHSLNLNIMDDTHREFVVIINQLNTASDADFKGLFEKLLIHTEAHFARENELMEKTGFPAIAEQKSK